jgi:hypothetical protein
MLKLEFNLMAQCSKKKTQKEKKRTQWSKSLEKWIPPDPGWWLTSIFTDVLSSRGKRNFDTSLDHTDSLSVHNVFSGMFG